MTDAEVQSSAELDIETAKRLVDSLPTHYPKHTGSRNYQIFGSPASRINQTDDDIAEVDRETTIVEAQSIESLQEKAKLVGILPKKDEPIEKYRARVRIGYNNITSEGTIDDLLEATAQVMSIRQENIDYSESDTPGLIILGLPKSALEDSGFESDEVVELLEQNIATGYHLSAVLTGQFGFRTIEEFENNINDPDAGYGGLDEDGNPKDVGGTYSTTVG